MRGRADEHRHHLGRRESGEPGAVVGEQCPAASATAHRVDGHTGKAQGIKIALDSSWRDLQVLRELTHGRLTVGLQTQEKPEQSFGTHGSTIPGK
ncbi:hypothetical protein GCM10009872_08050 [Actinopolymorpha rutila]